jgi:hypothetical protein
MATPSNGPLKFLYVVNKGHRETLSTAAIKQKLKRAFWTFTREDSEWVVCDSIEDVVEVTADLHACDAANQIAMAFVPAEYTERLQELKDISPALMPGLNQISTTPDGTIHHLDVFLEALRPVLPSIMQVYDNWHNYHVSINLWCGGLSMSDWKLQLQNIGIDDTPISMEHAMHPKRTDCVVLTDGKTPFSVLFVNTIFSEKMGFSFQDLVGDSLQILQGEATDRNEVQRFMAEIGQTNASKATFVNYLADKTAVSNSVTVSPIFNAANEVQALNAMMKIQPIEVVDSLMNPERGAEQMGEVAHPPVKKKTKQELAPLPKVDEHFKLYPSLRNAEAIIVTLKTRPFPIVYVNGPWETLCKFSSDDVVGKQCDILQGPETDLSLVRQTVARAEAGEVATMLVKNYKQGCDHHFRNQVTLANIPNTPFMIARLIEKGISGEASGGEIMDICVRDAVEVGDEISHFLL